MIIDSNPARAHVARSVEMTMRRLRSSDRANASRTQMPPAKMISGLPSANWKLSTRPATISTTINVAVRNRADGPRAITLVSLLGVETVLKQRGAHEILGADAADSILTGHLVDREPC